MLATRVRVRPCIERCSRPSDGRSQTTFEPSTLTLIWAGRERSSVPFGPVTLTWLALTSTDTPAGTGIGSLPIRLNSSSPDVAQYFTAEAGLVGLAAAHHALAGAEHDQAEPTEDARDLGLAGVDPEPGLADPLDAADHALAVGPHLELDAEHLTRRVGGLLELEAGDVALFGEDARQLLLQLRGGHEDLAPPSLVRVSNPGQHVRDRVADDTRVAQPGGGWHCHLVL